MNEGNSSFLILELIDEIMQDKQVSFNVAKDIVSSKTVFTTPNIVFNVQKMDEANLNSAFNYINRRLGSQY